MTMAVLVLDLAILTMNHQLGLLVLCDLPGPIDGVLLSVKDLGVLLGAGAPDGPSIVAWDNMLVALHLYEHWLHGKGAATWVCGGELRRGQALSVRVQNAHRTHTRNPGGTVPPKPPNERQATLEELSRAISQLTSAELVRLASKARLLLWDTGFSDPKELLGEAVKRALIAAGGDRRDQERGRPWPIDRVELPAFLSGCMESIADSARESVAQKRTHRLEVLAGEYGDVDAVIHGAGLWNPDVVEQALDAEEAAERQEKARTEATAIEQHFKDDQEVLAILEGEKAGMSVAEVLAMFDLGQRTYDSARRRLRRQVDKLMPGRRQQ